MVRQPVQIGQFRACAQHEETGRQEDAGQRKGGQANPVGRNRHAQRPCIEGGPGVAQCVHGAGFPPAGGRSEGGTKRRSVASAMAIRIWNSSTSNGTGGW